MARAFRKGVTGIFIMMAGCCASKKASHQTDERPLLLVTTTLRHRQMDLIPYGRGRDFGGGKSSPKSEVLIEANFSITSFTLLLSLISTSANQHIGTLAFSFPVHFATKAQAVVGHFEGIEAYGAYRAGHGQCKRIFEVVLLAGMCRQRVVFGQ